MLLDRIEKLGRIVLWLAISSACVIAPITYLKLQSAAAEMSETSKKEKETQELEERSGKTRRLALGSMGEYFTALAGAQGQVFFSNVSARGGVLCVHGAARNRVTMKSTTSLPACKEVAPYETAVQVSMMFAGGDMADVCPTSSACDLKVGDALEAQEGTAAEAPVAKVPAPVRSAP